MSEIHLIVKGSVRGEMFGQSGKVVKIDDLTEGELIAPAFMFGVNNFYPINITANEDVETICFSKKEFVKLLQNNGKALGNYLYIVSSKAQFLSQKLNFFTFKTIKEKFMFYVSSISRKNGSKVIRLPLSQEKLAEQFGVTRPALGRAIRELHNEKKIIAKGKEITITGAASSDK
ncbi:MAG: Crp/Fnr family transcriptional regulator [Kiritimatiellae bacterium]|jgi:CRP-like cAMP-binding protein|nr:Crp/Fnr family transcriptional regulator [Kiritimatiellia bacterium]